jgi:hypothetical protein
MKVARWQQHLIADRSLPLTTASPACTGLGWRGRYRLSDRGTTLVASSETRTYIIVTCEPRSDAFGGASTGR